MCDMKFNARIVSFMLNVFTLPWTLWDFFVCSVDGTEWSETSYSDQLRCPHKHFSIETAEPYTIDDGLLLVVIEQLTAPSIFSISSVSHCRGSKEEWMNLAPTIKRLVGVIISRGCRCFFSFLRRTFTVSQLERPKIEECTCYTP